jgi:hypothetical protein
MAQMELWTPKKLSEANDIRLTRHGVVKLPTEAIEPDELIQGQRFGVLHRDLVYKSTGGTAGAYCPDLRPTSKQNDLQLRALVGCL